MDVDRDESDDLRPRLPVQPAIIVRPRDMISSQQNRERQREDGLSAAMDTCSRKTDAAARNTSSVSITVMTV